MEKKTAMQMVYDKYLESDDKEFFNWFSDNKTELLETEKNQIVDAYRDGKSHEANGTLIEINMDGEEYFTQTYQTK